MDSDGRPLFWNASMRPRPEGRGEPDRPPLPQRSNRRLQCGHDPKAVENMSRSSSLCASAAEKLQCGHDPKAVENARAGSSGTSSAPTASMRPRPEGRGEPFRSLQRTKTGKSFNAATTRRPWRTRPTYAARGSRQLLQCGHDPKAVENLSFSGRDAAHGLRASMRPRPEGRGEPRLFQPLPVASTGFNAATTRRPWRTASMDSPCSSSQSALQCGHDPKAVENEARAVWRSLTGGSFNAATTRRPWRTAASRWASGRRCGLQCGHDPKAVENAAGEPFGPSGISRLQCGHDPKAVENSSVLSLKPL